MTPEIETLFPEPILSNHIGRKFTVEELKVVDYHLNNTVSGESGNRFSKEQRVLENDKLKDIKKFIQENINFYIQNIEQPSNTYETYITHSFFAFFDKNQYHKQHIHQNSYIAGILYIKTNEDQDKIFFHKRNRSFLEIEREVYNKFNSDSWWFPVSTGKLILFPAHLWHSVERVTSDETRISLVFNTFIRGNIGRESKCTDIMI